MFASLDLHNQTIIDQNILEDEKILVIKCWNQDLNNKLSSISEGKIEKKKHFKVCELILRYRSTWQGHLMRPAMQQDYKIKFLNRHAKQTT